MPLSFLLLLLLLVVFLPVTLALFIDVHCGPGDRLISRGVSRECSSYPLQGRKGPHRTRTLSLSRFSFFLFLFVSFSACGFVSVSTCASATASPSASFSVSADCEGRGFIFAALGLRNRSRGGDGVLCASALRHQRRHPRAFPKTVCRTIKYLDGYLSSKKISDLTRPQVRALLLGGEAGPRYATTPPSVPGESLPVRLSSVFFFFLAFLSIKK